MNAKLVFSKPVFLVWFCISLAIISLIFSSVMIHKHLSIRALKIEQERVYQENVKKAKAALVAYRDEMQRSLNFDVKKFKSYKDSLVNIRLLGWQPKSLECSPNLCRLHYLTVKEEPVAIPQRIFFLDGDVKVSLSSDILSLTDASIMLEEKPDVDSLLTALPKCDDAVISVNYLQYVANNGVSVKKGNYSSSTPVNKLQAHKPFIKNADPVLGVYQLPWSITGLDESRFLFFTDWLYSATGLGISGASFTDGQYTFSGVQYCEV